MGPTAIFSLILFDGIYTNITSVCYFYYAVTPPSAFESLPTNYPDSEFGPEIKPYTHSYRYNPRKPTMSVSTQLFSIDPGWMSCLDGISAFYDPSCFLTPVDGLFGGDATLTITPQAEEMTRSVTGATSPEMPTLANVCGANNKLSINPFEAVISCCNSWIKNYIYQLQNANNSSSYNCSPLNGIC